MVIELNAEQVNFVILALKDCADHLRKNPFKEDKPGEVESVIQENLSIASILQEQLNAS